MTKGWIAVDFDGTLAHYETWGGPTEFGAPVPAMLERVKRWVAQGREVRIFTARYADLEHRDAIVAALGDWCERHGLPRLPVTNVKDLEMLEVYDDRAVQVISNTGKLVGASPLGFTTANHPMLQFFGYSHLPEHLREVSRPFCELAIAIAEGPANPEQTTALRKLLEAKDCAVRAALYKAVA